MKTSACLTFLSLLSIAACATQANTPNEQTGASDDALVLVPGHLYPTSDIQVCWVKPGAPTDPDAVYFGDAQEETNKAFVKSVITGVFHPRTRIRFLGWGTCAANDTSKTMKLYLRNEFHGDPGTGNINIDLAFDRPNAKDNRLSEGVVIGAYPHEFTHALGFDHEQHRVDSLCNTDNGGHLIGSEMPIGPPDSHSLMSYCWYEGDLSPLDEFGLKLAYAAPGRFVRRENGAVYRLTNADATKCLVTSDAQLAAFGAAPVIQPSAALTGAGLVTAPTNADTWSVAGLPACSWPDGFYQRGAQTYFAIGGDAVDGAKPTICHLDGYPQTKLYKSNGFALTEAAGAPLEAGRTDVGTCPWPDAFYRAPGSTTVYRREGDVVCTATPEMAFAMGAADVTDVPAGSSAIQSKNGAPVTACAWPGGVYRAVAGGGRWSNIYYYDGGNGYCEMVTADQPQAWNAVDWGFKFNPIAPVSGDLRAAGGPFYGHVDHGACVWPNGYYVQGSSTTFSYVAGADQYGFHAGWRCTTTTPPPAGTGVTHVTSIDGLSPSSQPCLPGSPPPSPTLTLTPDSSATSVVAGHSSGMFITPRGSYGGAVTYSTNAPTNLGIAFQSGAMVGSPTSIGFWPTYSLWPATYPVTITATANGVSASTLINVTVEACVPRTTCGNQCGKISDGCGGTLSCAACPKCPAGESWDPVLQDCVSDQPDPPVCHGRICE